MNCHMPRLNEGLQDVTRTHMIFSPTRLDMIKADHPNACNLCHVDQPVSWTLKHLKEWYATDFSEVKLDNHAPQPDQRAGLRWLKSPNEAVRLIAADALTRSKAKWALPDLIDALDDPYLLNRQFARKGLETMLGIRLSDFGYRFYMTPVERRGPLSHLRSELLAK